MKKSAFTLFLSVLFLLAACQGDSPTAPAEPTAALTTAPVPTATAPAATEAPPTAVPATEPAAVEATPTGAPAGSEPGTAAPDAALLGVTWAWEARDANGSDVGAVDVPSPEQYTLTFNDDGTFSAQVDCNRAAGGFTATPPDSISFAPGPTTLAACPPGSLADAMMMLFAEAATYRLEEDGAVLVIGWAGGGPLDTFRAQPVADVELPDPAEGSQAATGTVTAPDGVFLRTGPGTNYPHVGAAPEGETGEIIGVSEDRQWWLAAAPTLPGGQVWVAAAFVAVDDAGNVPVVAVHTADPELVGTPWEWVSTTDPVQGPVYVQEPDRTFIIFDADGTATIQADCNHVQATYTVDGSSLTITPGASTLAACPPDSQGDAFLQQLQNVTIHFIQGGSLYLDQMADGGTMRFVPQGAPEPEPDTPVDQGEASTMTLVSFGPLADPQPPIAGTTITGHLADDLVSGFAGCNYFSGTVTPVDDYFTIGAIVTTPKSCPQPAGVMEQETAFLAALAAVNGFQWQSKIVGGVEVMTDGQLFYRLPDGGEGVLNFVATE